jgi:hypothetical protein
MEIDWTHFRAKIYDMLGWWYYAGMPSRSWLDPFEDYGLLYSPSGRYKTRRFVHGRAFGGHDFEFAEIEAVNPPLENGQEPTPQRGFQGVILKLNIDKKFLGRTVIRFDAGHLNPPSVGALKRVGFLQSDFERHFEVYGDDPVEAHYLITPDLIQRLLNFRDVLTGRAVQCVFMGGAIYIILHLDNYLIRPLETPHDGIDHMAAMVQIETGEILLILEDIQNFLNSRDLYNRRMNGDDRLAYYRSEAERIKTLMQQVVDVWPERKACQHLTPHHQLVSGFWRLLLSPRL